jgi:hypothetical protein
MEKDLKIFETYRNIKITYNEKEDEFQAEVDTGVTRKNSKLSGIRTSIDNFLDKEPKAEKQKPISAFYMDNSWSGDFNTRKVIITGLFSHRRYTDCELEINARIKPAIKERGRKQWEFVCSYDFDKLLVDCKENEEKFKKIVALKEEISLLEDRVEQAKKSLKRIAKPNLDTLPVRE